MIAQGLAANGAKVYIGSRRKAVVEHSAKIHGHGNIHSFELDVVSKRSILSAVKHISEAEGLLHILVNCAGQEGPKSAFLSEPNEKQKADLGKALFENEEFPEWSDVFDINVSSHFFMTTAFLKLLEEGTNKTPGWSSSVVNITSISGMLRLSQNHLAYNASKAAASHLTRMLSTELALKGIKVRVNAIAPGVFPSEMTGKQSDTMNKTDLDDASKGLTDLPAGRSGNDQEMAGTALYLVSAAGHYTNGQVIVIDGGFTATEPSTT